MNKNIANLNKVTTKNMHLEYAGKVALPEAKILPLQEVQKPYKHDDGVLSKLIVLVYEFIFDNMNRRSPVIC